MDHYLFILRGVAGCGKSTWCRDHGLEPFVLSTDAIRLMLSAPVPDEKGILRINQNNNHLVFDLLFRILELRMFHHDFTVIDATHAEARNIDQYRRYCEKYQYKAVVVDFSEVESETLQLRNRERPQYQQIPEAAMKRMQELIRRKPVPKWVEVYKYSDPELEDLLVKVVPKLL